MKRILVFNWRDIKNPQAGGAEEFVHRIFSHLANMGWHVTLFTSQFSEAPHFEKFEGIEIIRKGNKITMYLLAPLFYLFNHKRYDYVVESINTIPFMTPFFVRKKCFVIIHHIAGMETYSKEFNPFFAKLLSLLQHTMPRFYGKFDIITVSESTKDELVSLGISNNRISVVHNGVYAQKSSNKSRKFKDPTIIYFGRVKRTKRISEIISAFSLVQRDIPNARLIIAGRGDQEYKEELEQMVYQEKIENVSFQGSVNQEEKEYYLASSWVYAITSVKEGWGISVIEANVYGIPVVGYRVPGIVDSVKDYETGLLVNDGDISKLSESLKSILLDDIMRSRLSTKAQDWAKNFTWEKSAEQFKLIIEC